METEPVEVNADYAARDEVIKRTKIQEIVTIKQVELSMWAEIMDRLDKLEERLAPLERSTAIFNILNRPEFTGRLRTLIRAELNDARVSIGED